MNDYRATNMIELTASTTPVGKADYGLASASSSSSSPKHNSSSLSIQLLFYSFVGYLFWSLFVVQVPYMEDYFGGREVMFYIMLAKGVSSNLVRAYMLWHYHRFAASTAVRVDWLVLWGGFGSCAISMGYPIFMGILGKTHPVPSLWLCLSLTCLMGGFNSLVVNAGYVLMSLCSVSQAPYSLIGKSLPAVVCWPALIAFRAIVQALKASDEDTTFIVACTSIVGSGILAASLVVLYRYKTRTHPSLSAVLMGTASSVQVYTDDFDCSVVSSEEQSNYFSLCSIIRIPLITVWVTNFFNYTVFPGQINLWTPSDTKYHKDPYRSFLIYMFAASDLMGRLLVKLLPQVHLLPEKALLISSIVRGVVCCSLVVSSSLPSAEKTVIVHDAFRMALIIFFGLSNGVIMSMANVQAPSGVIGDQNKFKVGSMISFLTVNGMLVGSLAGIGFKFLVQAEE